MPDDGELFAIPEFRWPWGREESLDSIDIETTRVIRRLRAIAEQNHEIVHRLRRLQMTQAQEDAAVQEILTDVGKLQAAGQAILAWIAEQPPEVDVSGLTAAVTQLDEATGGVVNIATPLQPPAEPVTPPASESPLPPVDQTPGGSANPTDPSAPGAFVVKVVGETYDEYVARADAAGVTPLDETTWDDAAPGSFGSPVSTPTDADGNPVDVTGATTDTAPGA